MNSCDRCGARAKVTVLFNRENILEFCTHHYLELAEAIAEAGGVLISS